VSEAPPLDVRGLSKRFGALGATRHVDFVLEQGARCALIGPNGAGKTTFVNLVCGRLQPSAGEIWIAGRNVTGISEAGRVKAGIGRTFQINSLFRRLTVEENLALATAERLGAGGLPWPSRAVRHRIEAAVAATLTTLLLNDRAKVPVQQLPYGLQRMVEIALALSLEPKILLLDEPAAGVPAGEAGIILDAIDRLPPSMAVLLIEHDWDVVARFAKRVAVLVAGELLVQGTPKEISEHAGVRALYLGERPRG
jgi:ABC-type branched-subunit amino acid transport system ATPase component